MSLTNKNNQFHKLTCIQFPGVVNDANKAIECLGGIPSISKGCESSKSCLELNFRPKDPFCKPALSSVNETTGLLLRIRVKKKKTPAGVVIKSRVLSTEILGITHELYFFKTLTDYQYLPLAPVEESKPNAESSLKCILNDIIPPSIPDLNWLEQPSSYFFIPPIFSRMTVPQVYSFCDNLHAEIVPEMKNVISKLRKTRSNFAHYVSFTQSDPTPTVPNTQALELVKEDSETLLTIKRLFDEKPVRGRTELTDITKIPSSDLKILLAVVAYNYVNGPWRGAWIKLGYDPRKDPQSRIWQCIDFRLKALAKLTKKGKKRNYSSTPIKEGRVFVRKPFKVDDTTQSNDSSNDERLYTFKPGVLPMRTQSFYQFCHIYVPEIQEMFSRLGEVLPGALCHEKRGWLPSGFYEQCRLILCKHTLDLLQKLTENKEQAGTSSGMKSQDDDLEVDDMLVDEEYNEEDDDDADLEDEEYEDDNIFQDSDIPEHCDT